MPEAVVVRSPNLPVLAGSLATALLKASSSCASKVEAEFRASGWFFEAHLEVEDPDALEASLANVLREGADKYSKFKVAPLTIGPAGDSTQLEKVARELGVQLGDKLYNRLSALGQALVNRYRGKLLNLLSSEWRLEVPADKVRVQEGWGSMRLPSLPRSASMYEMGRFFGLRDLKTGSATRALLDVRADASWWMLSLLLPAAPMAQLEIVGDDRRLVYVFFEPSLGYRYKREDFKALSEVLEVAEALLRDTGFFVEDVELARFTLLAHITSAVSEPFVYAKVPGSLRVWGLRLAGQRFQEVYSEVVRVGEVALMCKAFEQRFGKREVARVVAKDCAELGKTLQSLLRRAEAISRELRLDRFAALYKLLLRSLVEPGYAAPGDFLYELLRFLEVEDWRVRFTGILASRFVQELKMKPDEARETAKSKLNTLTALVRSVAGAR